MQGIGVQTASLEPGRASALLEKSGRGVFLGAVEPDPFQTQRITDDGKKKRQDERAYEKRRQEPPL